jgi:hypothetical protein
MNWRRPVYRLIALASAGGLAFALSIYPLTGTTLPAVLPAYAVLLVWRPRLWLFFLPALLPILDLAPQTGWFFLEEIDLLLLITVASCYWRGPGRDETSPLLPIGFKLGLALCILSLSVGIWRGAAPFPSVDANSFTSYLSPYNALRVGKAWLWALLLLPPLRWTAGAQLAGLKRYLVPGMLTGLALVCMAEIRERVLFPGLLNFSADYRASAPFSAMHTGGAALDGYLALTIPLIAVWLLPKPSLAKAGAATVLLACSGYASLSTFSRGLYLALAVALLIVYSGMHWRLRARFLLPAAISALVFDRLFAYGGYRALAVAVGLAAATLAMGLWSRRPKAGSAVAALASLLGCGLLIPFAHSGYAGERFATSAADLDGRVRHWQAVLGMMPGDLVTSALGMGMGRYPATYFWHNPSGELPSSYRFVDERYNRYLMLSAPDYPAGYGELLRFLQTVDVSPGHPYLLSFDVRTRGEQAFLHVNLCERQLLYARACIAAPLNLVAPATDWRRYRFALQSGLLATPDSLGTPPVQLEIAEEGIHSAIDIDNISLLDRMTERELIRNGSFSDANNYWFFSSDHHHLPWHIKNLPLNLYFELGLLGLLAFGILLSSTAAILLRRRSQGQREASGWLASIAAFLCVGLFDSLLDVPRITLLFMLVLSAAALGARKTP